MPNLIRFLIVLGVFAGVIYGGLFLVATYMEPQPRDMEDPIGRIKLQD